MYLNTVFSNPISEVFFKLVNYFFVKHLYIYSKLYGAHIIRCSIKSQWNPIALCFLSPQGTPFFSPYLIQQQPPQVLNFNPAMQGPFFPPQINQLNPAQLPPLQQEQPIPGFGPNNGVPAQNPPPVQRVLLNINADLTYYHRFFGE